VVAPDGRTVACGGRDSQLRLWDVKTGAVRILAGHPILIMGVAFSPDERRLASASADNTVRLWDLASGESRILRGHTGPVTAVVFSADGKRIISSSEDGTVRVWPDDLPDDPVALRAWIEAATSDR